MLRSSGGILSSKKHGVADSGVRVNCVLAQIPLLHRTAPVFSDASLSSMLCVEREIDIVIEPSDRDLAAIVAVETSTDMVFSDTIDAGSTLCLVDWQVVLEGWTELFVSCVAVLAILVVVVISRTKRGDAQPVT